jgi:hypothetical protein
MNAHALSVSIADSLRRTYAGTAKEAPVRPRCTIALAREAGASGSSVGAEVGRRLDCPVYDREVLDKVAHEMRRPVLELQALDEHPMTWLEECLGTLAQGTVRASADTYLKYLIGTIRGLGLVGRCVIVGRGAWLILPPQTTLRVRLVADWTDRVRTARERFGYGEQDAAAWVARTDEERAVFVKKYFRSDANDPHNYDLMLNLSRLSVSECADVVVQAFLRFEGREGR